MRKVEQAMVMAINNCKSATSGNTTVTYDASTQTSTVTLFGNKIAVWSYDRLEVSWAGYCTPTTTSRINALLFERFGSRVKGGVKAGKIVMTENGRKDEYEPEAWITLS